MITAAGAFGDSGQKGIGSGERGGGAIAYADGRGDVSNDLRGMAEAQALGQAMVMSVKQYK